MAVEFLVVADLTACIRRDKLVQLLDDDGDGIVVDADPTLVSYMEQAEGAYYSRMLRSLDRPSALRLVQNDPNVRRHVAWICCELISERRDEFTNQDGHGAYWTQYVRATTEIDLLSKGQARSIGEQQSGSLANSGGYTSSRTADPVFAFAPSRRDSSGNGPVGGGGGF